jgi:hypothetical protein
MLRRVQNFIRLTLVAVWAMTGAAAAQTPLPLQGDEVSLATALSFALDDGTSLAEQAACYRDGVFAPDLATAMTGWTSYQPVWAAVTLSNPCPPMAAQATPGTSPRRSTGSSRWTPIFCDRTGGRKAFWPMTPVAPSGPGISPA